ncbi:MAG: hypothetical protein AB1815_14005, partial [Bacillota bacterium]
RLCKELDILAPQRRIKVKHPRRLAINRQVTASDQLWEIDVKYTVTLARPSLSTITVGQGLTARSPLEDTQTY